MRVMNKILLALAVSLLVACASNSPPGGEEGAISSGSEKATANSMIAKNDIDPQNRVICKERAITGSRFKQKTCMTAKEWETMSNESKRVVDKATRNKVRYTD
ncbi:hypothetical protein [Microbulbifer hainanensis]|uniref:hypothetical protein n=1 Tax=Microbulbifer hainanensis TaxID=2735675 RepID=UPI00186681B8|nr:hypothetical protein [Microbulbifer hainanensis]